MNNQSRLTGKAKRGLFLIPIEVKKERQYLYLHSAARKRMLDKAA